MGLFLILVVLSCGLVAATYHLAQRLTPENNRPLLLRWLIRWSAKGLGLPVLIWSVMNLGLSWWLQPFMPQIQAARSSGGSWFPDFLEVLGSGVFVISSYWTTATLSWLLVSIARGAEDERRKDFRALCLTCFLGLIVPAVIVLLVGGWSFLGVAGAVILMPLAVYAPAYLRPQKPAPLYARAIARMKFGKYTEAEWEIIRELERCEDDFEGWMMLADLYANHFNDLGGAERAILDLCEQPAVNASQQSVALQRLADWHLKIARDPRGARRALQLIVDRLKGTHLARMAALRIDQLPQTAEELRQAQDAGTVPLPALGDSLDQTGAAPKQSIDRKQAARLANAFVETLKGNPDNVSAREKLARIFAEQLERADLGIEQLDLLLAMLNQPENKRAEWLGLTAAWQLKYRGDKEAGRRTLKRLIREFPATAQALAARYRLEQLDRELRGQAASE